MKFVKKKYKYFMMIPMSTPNVVLERLIGDIVHEIGDKVERVDK